MSRYHLQGFHELHLELLHPTTAIVHLDMNVKQLKQWMSTNESAKFNLDYRKIPKFLDARNFAVIHLKFKQRGQT